MNSVSRQVVRRLSVDTIVAAVAGLIFLLAPVFANAQVATITSIEEGDVLNSGGSISWVLDSDIEISRWQITIGASQARPTGLYTSPMFTGSDPFEVTVGQLPADGEALFLRLSFLPESGAWVRAVYEFQGTDPLLLANITTPVAGTELSTEQTFSWSKGLSLVEQWSLTVGSRVGAGNYFSSGIRNTSEPDPSQPMVVALPADGKPVYARFSYRVKGAAWIRNDYVYTAPAPVEPEVAVSPEPGATLNGYDTITWSTNETSIKRWIITVGATEARPTGLFTSGTRAGTAPMVAELKQLPADGEPLYLRLRYLSASNEWRQFDYQYQAVSPELLARITSPAEEAVLSDSPVFNWQSGLSKIDEWTLSIGTNKAKRDIFYSGIRSYTGDTPIEANIPSNGQTVYVRFAYRYKRSAWINVDSSYVAAAPVEPEVAVSPEPGSMLNGYDTITWSTNETSIKRWIITVGATEARPTGLFTSGTRAGTAPMAAELKQLPADGEPLYLRLRYLSASNEWRQFDYQYQAVSPELLAGIISPIAESILPDPAVFNWQAGLSKIDEWTFAVGTRKGQRDIFYSGIQSYTGDTPVEVVIPNDGEPVFVRLAYRYKRSAWTNIDTSYIAPPPPEPGVITSPEPGTVIRPKSTFSWDPKSNIYDQWQLSVGKTSRSPQGLFNSPVFDNTAPLSVTATGLPYNSKPLFVRLRYRLKGEPWINVVEEFTAADSIQAPEIESPATGSVIGAETTFTLVDDDAAMYRWRFNVGSSSTNKSDIYSSPVFSADDPLTITTSIPQDLTDVFVELLYREKATGWKRIQAEYQVALPIAPMFVSPQANSELRDLDTLTWSAGDAQFDEWSLSVGSGPEQAAAYFQSDVFSAGSPMDIVVSGLPTDGARLYARVLYRLEGQEWREFGETFTAFFDDPIGPVVDTHHESIPNPVYGSSFRVAAACRTVVCDWDNATTWLTGEVPDSTSLVIVNGHVQIRDRSAIAQSVGIYPAGSLTFATDSDTKLEAADLLVFAGSTLEIGTENVPIASDYSATVVFRDISFDANDPTQILRGLVAPGGEVRVHGRKLTDVFVRTATEPAAGDSQIVLTQSAHDAGWRVGDQIVVPGSAQCAIASGACADHTEDLLITAISSDGLSLTLNQALQFDHPGARDHSGALDYTPHVVNKSRNVIFRSENPQGVRGHLLLHGRVDVDIRYAEFLSLGRTDIRNLGDTNQKGRYPIHAHHLIGPVAPQPNGYQYSLVGNTIDFGEENRQQDRKWGLTIHGSHYGLIDRNIVDYASGAGMVTESGAESGNMFSENFVVRVVGGNGERTEDFDPVDGTKLGRAGSAYWFNGGGRNQFYGNVAAAIAECVYCYGFKFDNVRNGELVFPTEQGADPHMTGGEIISADAVGLNNFVSNEAYAVPNGLTVWWECTFGDFPNENCSSRIDSFLVWHHHRWGYFGYPTNNMTLDGFVVRGDPSILSNFYEGVVGLEFSDYMNRNLKIVNADIQNVRTGINMPSMRAERSATGPRTGFNTIEDGYVVASLGVSIWAPASVNGASDLPPQTTILRNMEFEFPDVETFGQELAHIYMHDTSVVLDPASMNTSLRNDVWIYNHSGVEGNDLYIVPDYQGTDYCDDSIGQCDVELSLTPGEITKAHIYPLRPVISPE